MGKGYKKKTSNITPILNLPTPNFNQGYAHLANIVDEVVLPRIEFDQLHGRQQLLEERCTFVCVNGVPLLETDDEVAKVVLQTSYHKELSVKFGVMFCKWAVSTFFQKDVERN